MMGLPTSLPLHPSIRAMLLEMLTCAQRLMDVMTCGAAQMLIPFKAVLGVVTTALKGLLLILPLYMILGKGKLYENQHIDSSECVRW